MQKDFGLGLSRVLGYTWDEKDHERKLRGRTWASKEYHEDWHTKGGICNAKVILHFGNSLVFENFPHLNIKNTGVQVLFIRGELLVEEHKGVSRALEEGEHFVLGGLSGFSSLRPGKTR